MRIMKILRDLGYVLAILATGGAGMALSFLVGGVGSSFLATLIVVGTFLAVVCLILLAITPPEGSNEVA